MEHIKDILANLTFNSPGSGTLHPMLQSVIDQSKVPVDVLDCSIVLHAPATQLSEAKPYIHQAFAPYGGYNGLMSEGNWFDRPNNCWCPEPIALVRTYTTGDILRRHLATTLRHSYAMGRALGESAIALEILTNNVMLIVSSDR